MLHVAWLRIRQVQECTQCHKLEGSDALMGSQVQLVSFMLSILESPFMHPATSPLHVRQAREYHYCHL